MRPPFFATLLFLLVYDVAASHNHNRNHNLNHNHNHTHQYYPSQITHGIKRGFKVMEKRTTFYGRGTFFSPGQGACGNYASSSDRIVALSMRQYGQGGDCNRRLMIQNDANGKSTKAVVQDACEGCHDGDLDMSPTTFDSLGNPNEGVLKISWWFIN